MAVSKALTTRRTSRKSEVGLLAIGVSGPWEIAIDETTSGPERWFAQIEGPAVYLYFEISSLAIIAKAMRLLARNQGEVRRNGTPSAPTVALSLGTSRSTPVKLLRDDEFCDRVFLSLEPKHGTIVRFTVTGADVTHVLNALRQVNEELDSNLK